MRFSYFLLAFLVLTSSQLLAQLPQLPGTVRNWSDNRGNLITTGVLVLIKKNQITVKTQAGVNKIVAKALLADDDRKHVDSLYFYQEGKIQYDLVAPTLKNFQGNPKALLGFLEKMYDLHPDAPYAPSMMGVAYAKGEANYLEAKKYLKKAERLIKSGQKVLGPEFHRTTLTSIRNNIAVCDLKSGGAAKGAAILERDAKNLKSIPSFMSHNAKHALVKDEKPCSGLILGRGGVKKLGKILKMPEANNFAPAQQGHFSHSLYWDAPYTLNQILQVEQGNPLPPNPDQKVMVVPLYADDWCPVCNGSMRCKCNNGCAKGWKKAPPIWGVRGVNHDTGQKHMGWIKQPDVRCQKCGGINKIKCPCCKNGKE